MIKLYVADLQAYNNGELKGEWIELPMCEVELENFLESFPSDYAIHDYECDFEISEYMNIESLNEFAEMMAENKYSMEMLNMIDNWQDYDLYCLQQELENIHIHYFEGDTSHYVTDKDLMEDFAYWYMVESGYQEDTIPSEIRSAINWEKVADELGHSFQFKISKENGKLYWKSRY